MQTIPNIDKSHNIIKNVIVLRGTSGSGKSTFANLIAEPKVICCADDYFEKDGSYNFDASKLGYAHAACRTKFDDALFDPSIENIVVANTNTKPADFKYYVDAAETYGARITSVVLEKRHDSSNVHAVPTVALDRQHENLKNSIKLI